MVAVSVLLASFLCVSSVLTNGPGQAYNLKTFNDHFILGETAAHLVRQYFTKHSNTVVVIERSLHPELNDFNTRVLEYILQNLGDIVALQLFYGTSESQPWEYHVFIVDSEQAFTNISWNFPKTFFERNFRFLIVLTYHSTNYRETIQNIFTACKLMNVINVNILLNHRALGICMYKYKLFSNRKCDQVQPYLYFRFNDGFEKLSNMFPQKLLNLHRCPLRVCARQNHPMLIFLGNETNPKPEKDWGSLRGIDGQLIKILSKSMNFTIDLLPFPEDQTYFDNRTGYGCFYKLMTHEADIAIGGLSASDPKRFALTPSIMYHHSPIVFIVRGKRELDCVNRLGRPFSMDVWLAIAALLLVGAIILQVLRKFEPSVRQFVSGEWNDSPLLNFFAVFLGYPVVRVPQRNFARYLLILWLMMTLILRSAYQGSLYDSIRIDRFERVPKKYDELFRENFQFLVSKFYNDMHIFNDNQTIIVSNKHGERLALLSTLKGRFATVALRDHVVSYLERHFRQGCDLRIVDEQVYQFQTAIYFQKHSIYVTAINTNLRKFKYAGIVGHIVRNTAKDRQLFKENKKAAPLRAMTNDRIWSLYLFFMWLLGFTVVVFLLELLSIYCVRLRNLFASLQ